MRVGRQICTRPDFPVSRACANDGRNGAENLHTIDGHAVAGVDKERGMASCVSEATGPISVSGLRAAHAQGPEAGRDTGDKRVMNAFGHYQTRRRSVPLTRSLGRRFLIWKPRRSDRHAG